MSSPFQQLLSEFERIDGRAMEQTGAVIALAAIALCLAAWVVRHRDPKLSFSHALGHSVFTGITFPVVTLAFVWVASLVAKAWTSGMVFKLALPIFASLVAIRIVARVRRARHEPSLT
jgi:hypothetical protein